MAEKSEEDIYDAKGTEAAEPLGAAVLVATLWLPVLQIFGSSMSPTLQEGQIVVSVKVDEMTPGDIAMSLT